MLKTWAAAGIMIEFVNTTVYESQMHRQAAVENTKMFTCFVSLKQSKWTLFVRVARTTTPKMVIPFTPYSTTDNQTVRFSPLVSQNTSLVYCGGLVVMSKTGVV